MNDYSQILKGILEGCILAVINEKEVYGYELAQQLEKNGFQTISEGSIYPILSRMQKENWIVGEFKTSSEGPNRKYYTITTKGEIVLAQFIEKWNVIKSSVDQTIKK
jgi:PadR family transcriptional regulator PadR